MRTVVEVPVTLIIRAVVDTDGRSHTGQEAEAYARQCIEEYTTERFPKKLEWISTRIGNMAAVLTMRRS